MAIICEIKITSNQNSYLKVGLGDMAKSVITLCFFFLILIHVDSYHNIYLTIIILLNYSFKCILSWTEPKTNQRVYCGL